MEKKLLYAVTALAVVCAIWLLAMSLFPKKFGSGTSTYSGPDNIIVTTVTSTNWLASTTGTMQTNLGVVANFGRTATTATLDLTQASRTCIAMKSRSGAVSYWSIDDGAVGTGGGPGWASSTLPCI